MEIASVSAGVQDYEASEYLEMVSGIVSQFVFLCMGKAIWVGYSYFETPSNNLLLLYKSMS